jgi:hypothetical protein
MAIPIFTQLIGQARRYHKSKSGLEVPSGALVGAMSLCSAPPLLTVIGRANNAMGAYPSGTNSQPGCPGRASYLSGM